MNMSGSTGNECACCRRTEQALIEEQELRRLGHRIIFDTKTGWSRNIYGCHCDPSKLDENGYRVRM